MAASSRTTRRSGSAQAVATESAGERGVAGGGEPQPCTEHQQRERRHRRDEQGECTVGCRAGAAQCDQGHDGHGGQLEGDQPGAEVARGGDARTTGGGGEQQGGGDRRVAGAAAFVVEQRERGRGGQQDAGLQRARRRARRPQASAVGGRGGTACAPGRSPGAGRWPGRCLRRRGARRHRAAAASCDGRATRRHRRARAAHRGRAAGRGRGERRRTSRVDGAHGPTPTIRARRRR